MRRQLRTWVATRLPFSKAEPWRWYNFRRQEPGIVLRLVAWAGTEWQYRLGRFRHDTEGRDYDLYSARAMVLDWWDYKLAQVRPHERCGGCSCYRKRWWRPDPRHDPECDGLPF